MCGIAGFFQLDHASPSGNILRNMADAMKLRGPDGEGFFIENSLALAHRRLAVIDLSTGDQPMTAQDGKYTIVFNGEIFNFLDLKQELEAKGHTFRTKSDTEVILELYRAYGTDAFRRMNGFFAFALYDKGENKLIICRDRLGVKPLYYFENRNTFAFASSLNALKQHNDFPDTMDMQSLAEYLAYQYVPAGKTIFRGVALLPAAHYLVLDLSSGCRECKKYWDPSDLPMTTCSYSEAMEQLRMLTKDAVQRRMIADVPLGVFLSGGLDSAIVAAQAAELAEQELHCFSIAFEDPAYDESQYAKDSAQFIRTLTGKQIHHHIKTVQPCDFDLLKNIAAEFGEPYADASMLPTCLLSQFTRQSVTVALSGDGADELFGGYDRYRAMKMMGQFPLPRAICNTIKNCLPAGGERTFAGRLRRFLTAAGLPADERYRFIMTHGADSLSARCAGDALISALCQSADPIQGGTDPAWRYPFHDMLHYMPGDVLRKVDVCSMMNSLEVRSPFLDYRIAEFALSLPAHWKLQGSKRKKILADTFRTKLVPDLGARKKRGFGVPIAAWFRGCWKEHLQAYILEGLPESLFKRQELETLLAEHGSGKADHSYYLFSLLMLALFMKK